jgi:hypothetical protein
MHWEEVATFCGHLQSQETNSLRAYCGDADFGTQTLRFENLGMPGPSRKTYLA